MLYVAVDRLSWTHSYLCIYAPSHSNSLCSLLYPSFLTAHLTAHSHCLNLWQEEGESLHNTACCLAANKGDNSCLLSETNLRDWWQWPQPTALTIPKLFPPCLRTTSTSRICTFKLIVQFSAIILMDWGICKLSHSTPTTNQASTLL